MFISFERVSRNIQKILLLNIKTGLFLDSRNISQHQAALQRR
jgi:hypothetical protein